MSYDQFRKPDTCLFVVVAIIEVHFKEEGVVVEGLDESYMVVGVTFEALLQFFQECFVELEDGEHVGKDSLQVFSRHDLNEGLINVFFDENQIRNVHLFSLDELH